MAEAKDCPFFFLNGWCTYGAAGYVEIEEIRSSRGDCIGVQPFLPNCKRDKCEHYQIEKEKLSKDTGDENRNRR